MHDEQAVLALLRRYQNAIHTQDREAFLSLWTGADTDTLISIGKCFVGTETIYRDFLIGGIQRAYSHIDLISDGAEVHFLDDDTAVTIFRYHTDCIRRGSGEPYSIAGLETQVVRRCGGEWKLAHVHYSKV